MDEPSPPSPGAVAGESGCLNPLGMCLDDDDKAPHRSRSARGCCEPQVRGSNSHRWSLIHAGRTTPNRRSRADPKGRGEIAYLHISAHARTSRPAGAGRRDGREGGDAVARGEPEQCSDRVRAGRTSGQRQGLDDPWNALTPPIADPTPEPRDGIVWSVASSLVLDRTPLWHAKPEGDLDPRGQGLRGEVW